MSITAIALVAAALSSRQGSTIATVNGEPLTSQTYYRRMEYLPGLGRRAPNGKFVEIMPAIATLDTMVTEMLLIQIGKQKGLLPTEPETDQEIAYQIRKNANFVTDWQAVGRTMPELRHMVKVDRIQFKIQTEGIVITETDIQRAYDAAKDSRFTVPTRVKLRVITVTDADVKTKVDESLKAGKTFENVATQYSTDASKTFGGDFGVVPIDLLGDQVKTAIKDLKKGERTDWLSSDKIFAKFQVDALLPASVIPLDASIREDLRRELMIIKGSSRVDMAKLLRDARQNAKISITSPEVDKAYKQFIGLEKSDKPGG